MNMTSKLAAIPAESATSASRSTGVKRASLCCWISATATQIFDIALDECSSWRRGVVDRRNVLVDCLTQSVLADIASSCSEDVLGQPLADLLRVQAPIVEFEPGRGKRAAARRAG